MATDDCAAIRDIMITLPPRRVLLALTPEEALDRLRIDYGLTPSEPVFSSEREPAR